MILRPSIFHKMLITPLIGLLLFASYMVFVYVHQRATSSLLSRVQSTHVPVIQLANENLVLFDSIINSFRQKQYTTGIIDGINLTGKLLAEHFPIKEDDKDELVNELIIID